MSTSFEYIPVQLSFDSTYPDIGTPDAPVFYVADQLDNVVGVEYIAGTCTFTYYVTSAPYNTFTITNTPGTGGIPQTCTLPAANYTSLTIPTAMVAALTAAQSGAPVTYTVVVDTATLKLYVIDNNVSSVAFTLGFAAVSAATELGFVFGQSYASTSGTITVNGTTYTSKHYVVSPDVIILTGPGPIYIHGDILNQNYQGNYRINGKSSAPDILGKIPVNNNPGSVLDYYEFKPMSVPLQEHAISRIAFYLTLGTRTTPLALNGGFFTIDLRLFQSNPQCSQYKADGNGNGVLRISNGNTSDLAKQTRL